MGGGGGGYEYEGRPRAGMGVPFATRAHWALEVGVVLLSALLMPKGRA